MKRLKQISACALIIFLSLTLINCGSKKEDPAPIQTNQPGQSQNTSGLAYYIIDTAKVIKVSSSGNIEKTILNRRVNTSSYIRDLALSGNGTSFIYSDVQGHFDIVTGFLATNQIRIFDLDNNTDSQLFSTTTEEIIAIKYCEDGKIFFARKNNTSNSVKFATMNADGTGLDEKTSYYDEFADISTDRRFILLNGEQTPFNQKAGIMDLTMDNGAGGRYHDEIFEGTDDLFEGTFTVDGSKAVIPYRNGGDIKIRIVDISAKTSITKTIITGLSSWAYVNICMAHDNNTGVLAIYGDDFPTVSKVYTFELDDSIISSFDNQNKQVHQGYIY